MNNKLQGRRVADALVELGWSRKNGVAIIESIESITHRLPGDFDAVIFAQIINCVYKEGICEEYNHEWKK